jgi:hypothetical protein
MQNRIAVLIRFCLHRLKESIWYKLLQHFMLYSRQQTEYGKKILNIALKFLLKLWDITSQAEHDHMKKHRNSSISNYINGAGATSGDVRIINVKPT